MKKETTHFFLLFLSFFIILLLSGCMPDLQRQTAGSFWLASNLNSKKLVPPCYSYALFSEEMPETSSRNLLITEMIQNAKEKRLEERALFCAQAGIEALSFGDGTSAAIAFDEAINIFSAAIVDEARTQQILQIEGKEIDKFFKGESHERSFIFILRGILYMASDDLGNAQACFKNACTQAIISNNGNASSIEWNTAQALLSEIERIDLGGKPDNLLLIIWGRAPVKIFARELAMLQYRLLFSPIKEITPILPASEESMIPIAEDQIVEKVKSYYISQKKREVDKVLADKKQASDKEKEKGKTASEIASIFSGSSYTMPIALAIGAYAGHKFSESGKFDFRADVRQISNIPNTLSLYKLSSELKDLPIIRVKTFNSDILEFKLERLKNKTEGPTIWFVRIPY